MLSMLQDLFKVLGFEAIIKRDSDGNRLELNYTEDDDFGNYKFIKIRDAFDVSVDNQINEYGFLYNFATFGDNNFMISELGSEDI